MAKAKNFTALSNRLKNSKLCPEKFYRTQSTNNSY